MNLALFDFDGTLTTKDSLGLFLKYSVSKKRYMLNMLRFIPFFILWKTKLMKNDIAKQKLFKIFFYNLDEIAFKKLATKFALDELDSIIDKDRIALLREHQIGGDRVIVVSASMKCWLQPWCEKTGVELLCTELKFPNNTVNGEFSTQNCHGQEKVERVKKHLNTDEYDTIYAYGDSSGDDAMLSMAHIAKRY